MRVSSVTGRLRGAATVRDWEWWWLPWPLRLYVGAVPLAALAATALAAAHTSWHPADLVKFFLLLGCGLVSVAATRRIAYAQGAMVREFLTSRRSVSSSHSPAWAIATRAWASASR